MKPFNWIYAAWILVMPAGLAEVFAASPKVASHQLDPAIQAKVQAAYGRLPLAFEINQGQVDKKVKFLSRGSGYSLFLTPTEAVLQLSSADCGLPNEKCKSSHGHLKVKNRQSSVLRVKLAGASRVPQIEGLDQ